MLLLRNDLFISTVSFHSGRAAFAASYYSMLEFKHTPTCRHFFICFHFHRQALFQFAKIQFFYKTVSVINHLFTIKVKFSAQKKSCTYAQPCSYCKLTLLFLVFHLPNIPASFSFNVGLNGLIWTETPSLLRFRKSIDECSTIATCSSNSIIACTAVRGIS